MRRATAVALGSMLALAAAPAAARAQPVLALRVGWGAALGTVAQHVDVSEVARTQVPVQLDALWKFGRIAAGAYAAYGVGFGGACDAAASCSASAVRVGAQATLARPLARGGETWGGVGAGWEWLTHHRSRDGADVSTTWRGLELLSLQAGADLRVAPRLSAGPWVLLALGRSSSVEVATPEGGASADLPHRGTHAWILLGVRGRVDL